MSEEPTNPTPPHDADSGQYVVIARRYRPQSFEDLIGQQHVAKAMANAITTNRVGHAYLFTGARGVGKTSAARILAKALDCEKGPQPVPCNECDICQSISTGEDIDVLEIDGASNRGIDEIRQLRQNVNVRPSRSRFKIYIIDEVHMLTREAFNALLKTLEEPPEHVKFIFCTTEPTKIPITILSRCQRFDFAGIQWESIAERLRNIVDTEGVEAESEALKIIARRATGSMRDSQSLLEQLLAFAPEKITVADVHAMLGTAGDQRLAELAGHLLRRDSAAALTDLGTAAHEGVDVALLLEQLFGYFRDCMAALVGCPADAMLYASPDRHAEIVESGKQLGLTTILAVMQILEQTLSRLRYSTQGRILAELALVRICSLEDLEELSGLVAQLQSGAVAAPAVPRNVAPARQAPVRPTNSSEPVAKPAAAPPQASPPAESQPDEPPAASPAVPLTAENAVELWSAALGRLSGMVVEQAKQFDRVVLSEPNHLVVYFKSSYAFVKSSCERPEQLTRLTKALAEVTGQTIRLSFAVNAESAEESKTSAPVREVSPHQRLAEAAGHPMVQRAGELFGAQPTRVDDPPNRE